MYLGVYLNHGNPTLTICNKANRLLGYLHNIVLVYWRMHLQTIDFTDTWLQFTNLGPASIQTDLWAWNDTLGSLVCFEKNLNQTWDMKSFILELK